MSEMKHYKVHRPAAKPPAEKKEQSLSARAIRYLAGFLALMVLFTLLSRAADEMTIPRVPVIYPTKGTIDRTLTAYGKVEELSAQAVTTEQGLRVAEIAVKAGAVVEAGDPLFTLDTDDIQAKLDEAREALERMDMDISDRASQEDLNAQDRAKALERANQDYAAAKTSADRAVERAAKALSDAKAKLSAAAPPTGDRAALEAASIQAKEQIVATGDELARLQQKVEDEVAKAREEAQELGEDPDQREAQVRESWQSGLNEAAEKLASAQTAQSDADSALASYDQAIQAYAALRDSVDMAQDSYDQAVESRNNTLRAASRQIEDAQRPQAQDSSGEKAMMDREHQAQQVSRLEDLLKNGGVVSAPCAATVTGVSVTVGLPTPDGTAILLAGDDNAGVFTAQFPAEQEKYLSPGDEAAIKLGNGKLPLEGLKLETVAQNAADPNLLDVTVRVPEGTLTVGTAGELEVRRKSQIYECRVPLSALHGQEDEYFLLIARENAGFLGPELTAARLDVTVLEKNETMAAIQPVEFKRGQGFLGAGEKSVSAGDRVRLEVP